MVQQSGLSCVLCGKLKAEGAAYLLVSYGVDWSWSGVLQETVGLEKMVFASTLCLPSLPHTCSWPGPFSGSFLLPLPHLCVGGWLAGWMDRCFLTLVLFCVSVCVCPLLFVSLSLSQVLKSSLILQ